MDAQLPPPGGTTPTERVASEPDPAHMTIAEAAQVFDVSAATLRRKNNAGEIPGAKKVSGHSGDQWVFPVEQLERLFSRKIPKPGPLPPPAPVEVTAPAPADSVIDAISDLIERFEARQTKLLEMSDEARQQRIAELEADRDKAEQEAEEARKEAKAEAERREQEAAAMREEAAEMKARIARLEALNEEQALGLSWTQRRKRRKAAKKAAED